MTDSSGGAAETGMTSLTTWKGFSFRVRPSRADDEALLAEFFTRVSEEDRRFRFLSGIRKVGRAQIEPLLKVDHEDSENFLAFDDERLIGTAMLVAESDLERAEVAISLDSDYKNRGIGWMLLDHLASYAKSRGIKRIESVEDRSNSQALAVEADVGFRRESYPGDATLVLVSKDLESA